MPVKVEQLRIVHYPDPALRKKAAEVKEIDVELRLVVARMFELMREDEGVGLAAPQVGLSLRLFIANPTGDPADDRVFINPVLRDPSTEVEAKEEGCLSIPEVRVQVRRPKMVTIHATDLDGQALTLTSDALPARIWQHEIDHLDGTLIIDRASPLDRLAVRRKLKDLEERA